MKSVGYLLIWINASKLASGLSEGGVGLMMYFIFDGGSGFYNKLADRLFPVWPCLLTGVDDGRWHFCL